MLLRLTMPRYFLIFVLMGCTEARLMELPSGAELLVDHFETSFRCPETLGYFADEDHQCRVFHVCNPMVTGMQQFSFVCGNQTVFDQLNLACSHPEDAIPCEYSKHFSYINERFGTEHHLHYDADIERAAPYVPNKADKLAQAQSHQQDYQDPVEQTIPQESEQQHDSTASQAQEDGGGDLQSHQRQSTSPGHGHDFTVHHPQSNPSNAQSRKQKSTLRNSIRRRPRARSSFVS